MAATVAFVPPFFKDFGKAGNDIFSKKFDYENKVTIKNKAVSGVEVETQVGGKAVGKTKITHTCKKHGKFEGELSCTGAPLLNAKFETEKLVDGFKFTVSGNESLAGKGQVDYKRDNITASAVLDMGKLNSVTLSTSFGVEGVSIGGQCKYDFAGSKVTEYGAGWQWSQKDFTGTVVTKSTDKSDTVSLGYYVKKAVDSAWGGSFDYDLNKNTSTVGVANEYTVNDRTSIKTKAFSNGSVHAAIEHTLHDPAIKINVAAEFASPSWSCCFARKNLGVGISLGDF